MHDVLVMRTTSVRTTLLGVLAALTLLAGALCVVPPKASASLSQCSSGHVCVWAARNYEGQFSSWPASNTGCHNHESNPEVRSIANWTGYKVEVVGRFILEAGFAVSLNSWEGPITSAICWPPR
jgi:hypothetical protein